MQNISDLIDPDDKQCRTYREVNNSTKHTISIGSLVELEHGVRMLVVKQGRDCDGTPLYSLSAFLNSCQSFNGYDEDSLKVIYMAK